MTSADCPHCGTVFWVPKSLRGGIGSCPECQRAVEIKGPPDVAILVLVSAAAVLAASAATWWFTGQLLAAGIVLAALGTVVAIALLCM